MGSDTPPTSGGDPQCFPGANIDEEGDSRMNDTSDNASFTDGNQAALGVEREGEKQPALVNMDVSELPEDVHGGPGGRATHDCCNTLCLAGGQYYPPQSSASPQPHKAERKKTNALDWAIDKVSKVTDKFTGGGGSKDNFEEQHNSSNSDAHFGSKKNDKPELRRRIAEMEKNSQDMEKRSGELREALRKKDQELKEKGDEYSRLVRQANEEKQVDINQIATLAAELQDIKTKYQCEVPHLRSKMTEYKAFADKLSEQLSSLEQSNSRIVGGTGAHKDSHAIPPNLVKSVFVVNEAAFACSKTFIIFLKERKALQTHVALQSLPVDADERYRKYAVDAYICNRLFSGFENDGYIDSSDCLQGTQYLGPTRYEDHKFFLQTQDLVQRHEWYLREYEHLQQLGLQNVMEILKRSEEPAWAFHTFCCRKLVNIMDGVDAFRHEFPPSGNHSEHSLLHQLATNPKYCDKFLKPFVNLAMATFLLHRLAFQFNPPARIFRYAPGTKFNPTYMETAVPIDDDDSDVELIVGFMLVPGFQVGATIVKCTVYLCPKQ